MNTKSRTLGTLILVLFAWGTPGCGSGPPAKTANDVDDTEMPDEEPKRMALSAEVGALDEAAVDKTFRKTLGDLEGCLHRGAQRVEFIGGDVAFYIEVDADGQLMHTHLEQSSLGDRETETCMLDVLRQQSWPKPVGGEKGHARKSFSFDMPNDVRPPTEWSSGDIADALGEVDPKVAECKNGSSGTFQATMYVGTEGEVLGVGMTPPDADGEASIDCLVDALKSAKYPSPGSWPAKVSFSL